MKKRYCSVLLVRLSVILLSACGNSRETGDEQMQEMTVEAGGQKFQAALYDNETVRAFQERLPMTLDMEELHRNEKFYYLDEGLPANSENVGSIKAGDIMLFGSDCLVLFFEDFSTSYNYTRIGHIQEEEAFVKALSGGTVEMGCEAKRTAYVGGRHGFPDGAANHRVYD